MAKKTKSFRPKARVPRGLTDGRGASLTDRARMLAQIEAVFSLYGFEALETSALEYSDCLGKFLPDQDRPNEGVFSFEDDDGQWLSLRYDLTAPLARYVAEHYDGLPKPFRRYQTGPVWRNEKPGPGRFRQFTQFDADTVGSPLMAADAEICMLLAQTLETLGIRRDDFVIKVNNRKILDGVLSRIGLDTEGDDFSRVRLTVLRAIDKLDRLGLEGVESLLGEGRKDESGDFTAGAGLQASERAAVLDFLQVAGGNRVSLLKDLTAVVAGTQAGEAGLEELTEIDALLTAAGFADDRVTFDAGIVRGLEYYTGPVWEAELLFETKNEKGQAVRFGSVGSGGRYDGLVKRFKGIEVPATGCSIGVSRLQAALESVASGPAPSPGPCIVLVLDEARRAEALSMVSELRAAGVRSELYLGTAGMKAQLKYADRRASPLAIIEGEDERAAGAVTLKDLDLGARMSAEIADNTEWRQGQPAQTTLPRTDLVSAVKRILADQAKRGTGP